MVTIDTNQVLWKEKDGLVTVMTLADGGFFELNALGSEVWKLLAKDTTPDMILEILAPQYQVARHQLGDDITSFLKEMVLHGLLTA